MLVRACLVLLVLPRRAELQENLEVITEHGCDVAHSAATAVDAVDAEDGPPGLDARARHR